MLPAYFLETSRDELHRLELIDDVGAYACLDCDNPRYPSVFWQVVGREDGWFICESCRVRGMIKHGLSVNPDEYPLPPVDEP